MPDNVNGHVVGILVFTSFCVDEVVLKKIDKCVWITSIKLSICCLLLARAGATGMAECWILSLTLCLDKLYS